MDTSSKNQYRHLKIEGSGGSHKKNLHLFIAPANLFISIITLLELEIGILSAERRDPSQGAILRSWLEAHVLPVFSERTLNLDIAVAQRCAKLHVPKPQSDRDSIIAATALVHGMTIVTRNENDFTHTGVEIFNPWN